MRKRGRGRIYTTSYFLNQVAGEYSDMLRAADVRSIYFDGEADIIITRDMNLDKNIVIKSDRDIYFVKGRKSTKVTISELNLKCRTLYIGNNGIEITQIAFTCRAIDDPYDCLTGDCEYFCITKNINKYSHNRWIYKIANDWYLVYSRCNEIIYI